MYTVYAFFAFMARLRLPFAAAMSLVFGEGREAFLRRIKARTELEELAAAQKRMELEFQRADKTLDLAQKLARIKDPNVRSKLEAGMSGTARSSAKNLVGSSAKHFDTGRI